MYPNTAVCFKLISQHLLNPCCMYCNEKSIVELLKEIIDTVVYLMKLGKEIENRTQVFWNHLFLCEK